MVEVLKSNKIMAMEAVRGPGLYVDLDPPGVRMTIIDKQGNQVAAHLDHHSIDLLRERLQQVSGDGRRIIIGGKV